MTPAERTSTSIATARDACPQAAAHHQPGMPEGYVARDAWRRRMARSHRQTRCDGCGLWVVWVPR